ncbi:MAG: hypothetical protein ABSD42_14455 [Candidatus Bathyarchaeia archaeon]|jgi:aspartyl/asparaginyl-tRNA synthetase
MDKRKYLLKLKSFLLKKARSWFEDNGYVEVQGPMLVPAFGSGSITVPTLGIGVCRIEEYCFMFS